MATFGKVTLRNYRCFGWDSPAVLDFSGGFTAILGANNSGKSSALRSIFELRNFFLSFLHPLLPNTNFRWSCDFPGVTDNAELVTEGSGTKFLVEIEIDLSAIESINLNGYTGFIHSCLYEFDIKNQICTAQKLIARLPSGEDVVFLNAEIRKSQLADFGAGLRYRDGSIELEYVKFSDFVTTLAKSKYFSAFRNAINEGAGAYYDLPVGTGLVNAWDSWKAGRLIAQRKAISRVENEIAEILEFRSLQINADQTGKTLDVIVDGRPHKLYEVGAGVAQLIIVLAASLIAEAPYILIDEPELSLHPALQIKFLMALASYAQIGVFFSTHSMGLARSVAQRILVARKVRSGLSSLEYLGEKVENLTEFLGELSYSSRCELGCDGLILVEGSTEVLVFQEFLRKLNIDSLYVVMPLGGSTLINAKIEVHLHELTRILDMSKIHVFIDSERKKDGEALSSERQEFETACIRAGVDCHLSERRATENYFENKGIKRALGDDYQQLGNFDLLKESSKPWRKSDNFKIARETDFNDIEATDLGKFLQSLVSQETL